MSKEEKRLREENDFLRQVIKETNKPFVNSIVENTIEENKREISQSNLFNKLLLLVVVTGCLYVAFREVGLALSLIPFYYIMRR